MVENVPYKVLWDELPVCHISSVFSLPILFLLLAVISDSGVDRNTHVPTAETNDANDQELDEARVTYFLARYSWMSLRRSP